MKQYVLTIKVPFEALDDPHARRVLEDKLSKKEFLEEAELKLQEIFENKPPRKVEI